MHEMLKSVMQGAVILALLAVVFLAVEVFGVYLGVPLILLLTAWLIGWVSRDLLEWHLF